MFIEPLTLSFDDLIQMYAHFPETSYYNWPANANVSVADLAASDLIYTGIADKVLCVHCRGCLHSWCAGDIPAEEHRKFFPDCPSLRPEPTEALQCRVCMLTDRNTVLMPCFHLVLCGSCRTKLDTCPVCREAITGSIKVFLS
jgi:hypothetical protein